MLPNRHALCSHSLPFHLSLTRFLVYIVVAMEPLCSLFVLWFLTCFSADHKVSSKPVAFLGHLFAHSLYPTHLSDSLQYAIERKTDFPCDRGLSTGHMPHPPLRGFCPVLCSGTEEHGAPSSCHQTPVSVWLEDVLSFFA